MSNVTTIVGRAVLPAGVRPAQISFDTETASIVSVAESELPTEDNLLIFPGFVDLHVHAREYGRPQEADKTAIEKWEAMCRKETFATAGEAAVNGGVTLFAAMPNDPVPPDNPEVYALKQGIAASSSCPMVLFAAITKSSEPWADLPYKVYLDHVPSSVSFTNWNDLEIALSRYGGCRVFFHAEDPEVLQKYGPGARWKTRPPEAEIIAVEKILELSTKLGIHTHICHVSTRKAVELIGSHNRASGNSVTCEVTPHHLFFSVKDGNVSSAESALVPLADLLESNPPLRTEDDRRFMVEALKEGLVDVLASDHAPHTEADKRNGAPGMPHLDTLGPFAGWLMKRCGFTPVRVAEVLSRVPGKILEPDLSLHHGSIEPGAEASFTVLDLAATSLVEENGISGRGPLKTRCGWSPFLGIPLPAAVKRTIIRGESRLGGDVTV
jgi:dihydroorotase